METHPEKKSVALFNKLFPQGFAGEDIFTILAPDGWEKSNLILCFHPTLKQRYEEAVRMHENLTSLTKTLSKGKKLKKKSLVDKPPTIAQIQKEYRSETVEPEREIEKLIGWCMWDIFSDNHEVFDENGIYDIGSFRGSGGFIAEYINQHGSKERYDYMDFYMGSIWVRSRADLIPVYGLLFQRLKKEKCFWNYSFPRLGLVDFSSFREENENLAEYSPEKSFIKEKEKEEKEKKIQELQNKFDEIYEEEKKELQSNPPKTVIAYREVYGKFPFGWEVG